MWGLPHNSTVHCIIQTVTSLSTKLFPQMLWDHLKHSSAELHKVRLNGWVDWTLAKPRLSLSAWKSSRIIINLISVFFWRERKYQSCDWSKIKEGDIQNCLSKLCLYFFPGFLRLILLAFFDDCLIGLYQTGHSVAQFSRINHEETTNTEMIKALLVRKWTHNSNSANIK